ncbi:hypothetical protein CYMTET_14561 [Cymbomonas tetramitiformis]|uniref:Uncharacterized protein n=1 Tax=Cymbomonas tetramitiformis TaxID=36881 RepID=A0AAE0L9T5_9CHLO|nr:hypothetical protein CYMTET_14561 [Cymbomonas tetramitiformis]
MIGAFTDGGSVRWVEQEWHRHTVDRFASEMSAQLTRYYAQWCVSGFEWVGSLAYPWLARIVNCVNLPWSLLDEVTYKLREESATRGLKVGRHHVLYFRLPVNYLRDTKRAAECALLSELAQGCELKVHWPINDVWYSGTMGVAGADGLGRVVYDDGDNDNKEHLDMSKAKYDEAILAAVQEVSGWDASLYERWRGELGVSSLKELAVQMQGATLRSKSKTVGNYRSKAKAFVDFCEAEGCQWLPTTEASHDMVVPFPRCGASRRFTIPADGVQQLVRRLQHYLGAGICGVLCGQGRAGQGAGQLCISLQSM